SELEDIMRIHPRSHDWLDIVETSVSMWEDAKARRETQNNKNRHRRYYGFSSHYLFLNGLGPWHVTPGERHSIQAKRAVSTVTIRRQSAESELRLPVSRRLLSASISCDAIHINNHIDYMFPKKLMSPSQPVLYFWTPEYWYRPISLQAAYRDLYRHLHQIRRFQEYNTLHQGGKERKRKSLHSKLSCRIKNSERSEHNNCRNNFKHIIKTGSTKSNDSDYRYKQETRTITYLHKMLKLDPVLTAWNFDSSTLAYQITLIDKDLFLKIPHYELGVIVWLQSSRNAPNIGALIAFSHRISCLVTTEVLREESVNVRAQLITRFINVAEKCNRLNNFQSCRSVLAGLQSLPVYRLHSTWKYVRLHHATKYHVFEKLCRMYRDPRLPNYQKAFFKASLNPPYLPYIGDLLAKLLGRVPEKSLSISETLLKETEKPEDSQVQIINSSSHSSSFDQSITLRKSNCTILDKIEKIPGRGVGHEVKDSDSCLEDDENTIHEFIVSVLSEDESDSNSSSNSYSFDECDSSPVSKRILLQSKPINSKSSDVNLNEQSVRTVTLKYNGSKCFPLATAPRLPHIVTNKEPRVNTNKDQGPHQ
ncbi:hypothetical protein L9F63_000409, partial [Diploptera punctata]